MAERKIAGLDRFEEVTADAKLAFSRDSGYLISMCQSASGILYKRSLWDLRKELREASAAAVEACSSESFTCTTPGPCSTGSCKFATGDLVLLDLPELPGKFNRPQPRPGHSSYDVEQAVRALLALREKGA